MSTIGAQCDELRAMAESVGLAMPRAATLMMKAADTIWVLREVVRRERAEADRWRELARKLAWCAVATDCGVCEGACEDGDEWPVGSAICTAVDHMMRELGVEVD